MSRGKLMSDNRNALFWTAVILVVIGAINWGLVGLFNFNLVAAIFGPLSPVSRVIYVLVGLAGLYLLYWAAQRPRPRVESRP